MAISTLRKWLEMNDLYSLVEYKKTEQFHLYESKKVDGKCCLKNKKPICKDDDVKPSSPPYKFSCEKKNEARLKSAEAANNDINVCGQCVSRLYTTKE